MTYFFAMHVRTYLKYKAKPDVPDALRADHGRACFDLVAFGLDVFIPYSRSTDVLQVFQSRNVPSLLAADSHS